MELIYLFVHTGIPLTVEIARGIINIHVAPISVSRTWTFYLLKSAELDLQWAADRPWNAIWRGEVMLDCVGTPHPTPPPHSGSDSET